LDEIFTRGGRELVDVLEFLVISFQMDPLFLFLVGEYRLQPTAPGAVALFDFFCSPASPAQISAKTLIPPRDMRLQLAVDPLRARPDETGGSMPVRFAPSYLFDAVTEGVSQVAAKNIEKLERDYDLTSTPQENLPGGVMTAGQRQFVEHVWQPHLRPRLVSAGFRRIANVG
jgi:hypothetical protein